VFAAALVGQSAATTSNGITAGDLYNQSVFFKGDATGLTASSIEINKPLKRTVNANVVIRQVPN